VEVRSLGNRIYSIAPAELRPKTMGEKLWSWPVVGIVTPIFLAGGIAAMYGDDYKLAIALYFVGIGLAAAKFLTWEENKAYSRRKKGWLWAATVIVAAVVFIACLYWIRIRGDDVRGLAKQTQPSTTQASKGSAEPEPTLESLFQSDFPNVPKYSFKRSLTGRATNDVRNVTLQVYVDYDAKADYVGFFVPHAKAANGGELTVALCKWLATDGVKLALNDMNSRITADQTYQGQRTRLSDLTFSGRVFIYTDEVLTMDQIVELRKAYKDDGLLLEVRGIDYLVAQIAQWEVRSPKQPQ